MRILKNSEKKNLFLLINNILREKKKKKRKLSSVSDKSFLKCLFIPWKQLEDFAPSPLQLEYLF